MNEINELVFQVYEELLNSDYKLNEKKTLSYILRKTFRYIVSGYIFQLRTNKIKMNLMNEFIPSNNKHKKRLLYILHVMGNMIQLKIQYILILNMIIIYLLIRNCQKDQFGKNI